MSTPTILVTGGAGFIGCNFVRYWLNTHPEYRVVNLDALTYAGNLNNLNEFCGDSRYVFVKGNICDADLVDKLVRDVDIVVHFAAETHVDRAILDPSSFIDTNVRGTFVLLEAVRKYGTHFHHISTDEVYGELDLETKELFSEDKPYAPRNPYSASKAAADHLVRSYHLTFGSPITITNCSNNFGPFQHPEKYIPRMITNLIDGDNIKIYGDGKYVRDWLHTYDHCRAIDLVLSKGIIGETYLIGGMQKEANNLRVAQLVLEYMGFNEDKIEFVRDRLGHDRRYAVDWSKIKNDLGWEPQHTFENWLQKTVNWYKDNDKWWRPLKKHAESIYGK
jgi:dTDP-glucose 4,6-dehydratase